MAEKDLPYFSTNDSVLGNFVYCMSHMRVHATGWCTVPVISKIALVSETIEGAQQEWDMKKIEMRMTRAISGE